MSITFDEYLEKNSYATFTHYELKKHDAQVRADVIEKILAQINKTTTFYLGDKEGNSITPKMIDKDEVIKVIEQLREKSNE